MADKNIWGVVAEFENPARLVEGVEKLRSAGYSQIETWTPFPIHGMEETLGLGGSKVSWITLAGGLSGLSLAIWLQWWTAAVDYPVVIGGKPLFGWEPSVPIMFELTVLLSAIATFVGMVVLNKLPRPFHPLDRYPAFRRVTDDKFFLTIEAGDPKFDSTHIQTTVAEAGGINATLVEE